MLDRPGPKSQYWGFCVNPEVRTAHFEISDTNRVKNLEPPGGGIGRCEIFLSQQGPSAVRARGGGAGGRSVVSHFRSKKLLSLLLLPK